MLKPLLLCAGLVVLAQSPAYAAPSNIEVLRQTASASIYLCEMQLKMNSMKVEMQQSGPGQDEVVRRSCAADAEVKIQPQLSPVKEALKDKAVATANLKDWYATWMADIEALPLDGSAINELPLDEKMKKVVIEASW